MAKFRYGNDVNINVKPLDVRHRELYISFICKLINGSTDMSDLSSQLPLAVPSFNTRHTLVFRNKFHTTNYGNTVPLSRVLHSINSMTAYVVELFNSLSCAIGKLYF